ncbi:MAG: helix-turn-helix domain-containing protein [Dehalococcoidia bacterium]|nr:helix-turn-helix domain-containing protein [Dehalococcoidia bacterium]
MTFSRWLPIGEAAKYLGLSPPTLRRYEADGDLASIRTPGGHRRYAKADLDTFMQHRFEVLEYRKRKRRNERKWHRRRLELWRSEAYLRRIRSES